MSAKPLRITLSGSAVVALAVLVLPAMSAAQTTEHGLNPTPEVIAQKPAVVAQAPANTDGREAVTITVVAPEEARPAARRGIRWGILEGADAARVYNARKQAVYNSSSWERMPGK